VQESDFMTTTTEFHHDGSTGTTAERDRRDANLSNRQRRVDLVSFEGDRFAESIRYVQSYPTQLEALRDVLLQIQTPVQIISGRRDAVVPLVNAEYLDQRLPHSQLHVIDAGHFIWEDAADEYAAVVSAWWTDGFKRYTTKSTHLLQEELR